MFQITPTLLSDYYKQSHSQQIPTGMTKMVSYLTPRMSRLKYQDYLICFGVQYFCKKYLIDYFNEYFFSRPLKKVLEEHHRIIANTMHEKACNDERIKALHSLGYLPIEIKALPEGTKTPIHVPMIEISNTHPDFAWLTNFIESVMSSELWHTMISANVGYQYRQIVNKYYDLTVSDTNEVNKASALGDFSFRGQHSMESATKSSAAFCLSFVNTATVPAIPWLEYYYNCNCEKEDVAYGAISTEHSVMCSNYAIDGDERTLVKRLLTEIYKGVPFSMVSDSYDYWHMLTVILPSLRKEIEEHGATFLVRGDSGDPVDIICGSERSNVTEAERKGTVEVLWDIFGGTTNSKGFKVLPSYIKAIYGDSITQERCEKIYQRLAIKGFAANNVTLGVGSFSFMCVEEDGILKPYTRDTFGVAVKATYGETKDKAFPIFKDPKTDTGHFKKSQKGLCRVYEDQDGVLQYEDNLLEEPKDNLLQTVFLNGKLTNPVSLSEVRNRLHGGKF